MPCRQLVRHNHRYNYSGHYKCAFITLLRIANSESTSMFCLRLWQASNHHYGSVTVDYSESLVCIRLESLQLLCKGSRRREYSRVNIQLNILGTGLDTPPAIAYDFTHYCVTGLAFRLGWSCPLKTMYGHGTNDSTCKAEYPGLNMKSSLCKAQHEDDQKYYVSR
jgi:hypothetical protein